MNLKYQIDSLEGLDEAIAKLYKKDGDVYKLQVEGVESEDDVAGLKKALQTERDAREAAEKAQRKAEKDAQKKAEDATAAAARKEGDVEALEKSWQKKYGDKVAEMQADIDQRDGWIKQNTVHTTALELATTLAVPGSADVLLPHIEKRLGVDVRDGRPTAVVLGDDGKPSALSVKELGEQISGNQAFAPLIVGSKASGGGANGASGGAAKSKTITRQEYDAMEPEQRQKIIVEDGVRIAD